MAACSWGLGWGHKDRACHYCWYHMREDGLTQQYISPCGPFQVQSMTVLPVLGQKSSGVLVGASEVLSSIVKSSKVVPVVSKAFVESSKLISQR